MTRKLNEDEVKICEKALVELTNQMKGLNFNLKYQTMMLEEGLEIQHLQNIKLMSLNKTKTENEIENINEHLKILNDQLKNGVELKEEKEDGPTAS